MTETSYRHLAIGHLRSEIINRGLAIGYLRLAIFSQA
jgi:hypothetical protein